MCLILFANKVVPGYPLVLAANRDEFYKRPTAAAHWWEDAPHLLAGKDLEAGGTWLGMTKTGRFAALTNYRGKEFKTDHPQPLSRGHLVSKYLLSEMSSQEYFDSLMAEGAQYKGFNLIFGDISNLQLYYYSNALKVNTPEPLGPGFYGLSNDVLDTPWPKVQMGKQRLQGLMPRSEDSSIETDEIFSLLKDNKMAHMCELQDTGLGKMKEQLLSPLFIKTPVYGTRSSTVLLMDKESRVIFEERGFKPSSEKRYEFPIQNE